jgi:hypothetical protein
MSIIEHPNARNLKWRHDHPEIVKQYDAKYYAANREKILLKKREQYRIRKEKYEEAKRLQAEQIKTDEEKNNTNNDEIEVDIDDILDEGDFTNE